MAGVSSESLTAARLELEAKLPFASLSLAEDLFGILSMLDSSAGLRRALTDPAREGKDKAALLSQLVRGKVSSDAESIAAGLASSRWASPRDIGDALESLAATVAIAVAENRGRTELDELENDLFKFTRLVEGNHGLQRAFAEPQAGAEAKAALALKLVPSASEEAKALIRQAVTHPRGLKPTDLIERFVELVAERQQRWIAKVSVTRPLTAAQIDRLQVGLNRLYGRDLKLSFTIDPTLIGGIRVKVGDEVVDASVVTRLSELRRNLAV